MKISFAAIICIIFLCCFAVQAQTVIPSSNIQILSQNDQAWSQNILTHENSRSRFDSLFVRAPQFDKKRFWTINSLGTGFYGGALLILNQAWYSQFDKEPFHFFDDSGEWLQMDKFGHAFTSYFECVYAQKSIMWSGVDRRKAAWIGVAYGTVFQTAVELLDATSAKWGFSTSDILANQTGVLVFLAQEYAWDEQRISLKVSSHQRPYTDFQVLSNSGDTNYNLSRRQANLYGSNYFERFLKDYNAQTIWASANIRSFIHKEGSKIPAWLNIAVGYGANNLYGGFENRWENEDETYVLTPPQYDRARQYYLSFDIDFSRIKTRSSFLNSFLNALNIIKIPSPALELTQGSGLKFRPIYF